MATPSYDTELQKSEIRELLKLPLKKGDSWYLIDANWFKKWKKFVGYESWDALSIGQEKCYPGPIDNSGILQGNTDLLKEHLIDEQNYQTVPEVAWNKLVQWFGMSTGQKPVERIVIELGMFVKHCKIELYKLEIKIHQRSALDEKPLVKYMSRADTIGKLQEDIRHLFKIPVDVRIKLYYKYFSNTYEELWKNEQSLQDSALYSGQCIAFETYKDGKLVLLPLRTNIDTIGEKTRLGQDGDAENTLTSTASCNQPPMSDPIGENTQLGQDGDAEKKLARAASCNQPPMSIISYCEPCFRGNMESATFSWCTECEENLCEACDKAHRYNKITMSHVAVGIKNMTVVKPVAISTQIYCETHFDSMVDFYCSAHDELCCRACIPVSHFTCKDVIPIDVASKNAKCSAAYENLREDVRSILQTTEQLKNCKVKNIEDLQKQEEKIETAMSEVKTAYLQHFQKLESVLFDQVSKMRQDAYTKINENNERLEQMVNDLKRYKVNLDFVSENGSDRQAFFMVKQLKSDIEKNDAELSKLISMQRQMNISFKNTVNSTMLENKLSSLGAVEMSEQPIDIIDCRQAVTQVVTLKANSDNQN